MEFPHFLPGWLLHCGFPWIFSSTTWRVHSRATIHLSQLCKSSKRIFIVYCVLCNSKTRFQYLFDSFEEVLISDKYYLTRRCFALLFSLIIYFQNNRRTTLLKPIWFLLHFRGLSYTGFHVLHRFGLCPSVRSVSTFLNYRSELDLHSPFQNVRWMDNLRHQLNGVVPADARIDWTVVCSVSYQSVSPCGWILWQIPFRSTKLSLFP